MRTLILFAMLKKIAKIVIPPKITRARVNTGHCLGQNHYPLFPYPIYYEKMFSISSDILTSKHRKTTIISLPVSNPTDNLLKEHSQI